MTNFSIYAIKSEKDGRIYVGLSTDPKRRLIEHNNGWTKSTKGYRPWELVYIKDFDTRSGARREEKRLKSGYGKEFLKSLG